MKNKYKIIVIVVIVFLLSSFYFGYSLGIDADKPNVINKISGTYQLFKGNETLTVTIDDQDNLYYQNGFENESIKIKTQITIPAKGSKNVYPSIAPAIPTKLPIDDNASLR